MSNKSEGTLAARLKILNDIQAADGKAFAVFKFYAGDYNRQVPGYFNASDAVKLSKEIADNAAKETDPGPVLKVVITDKFDNCVFEWRHDIGVAFPLKQ